MLGWLRSKTTRVASHTSPPEESAAAPPAVEPPAPTGALALYRAGRTEEAERAARGLLDVDASDTHGLLVQSLIGLDRGRTLEALRTLERAAGLAPTDADVQIALGRALAASGRKPAAAAAFERALELQPASGEPLLQLGLLARAGGRAEDALRQLSAAVASEPGHAEARFQLGSLLRERGQIDEAEPHFRRAATASPPHAGALGELGASLKDRGRIDEASVFLEQALKARPGAATALFNLGMLRVDQRRWHDAAELLHRYVALEPKQAQAQYWLGNASMGDGDAAGARKAYQAAVRLKDDHVQARWGLVTAQLPAVPQTDAEQAAAVPAFEREVGKLRAWFRTHTTVDGSVAVGAQQPYYLAYIPQNHRAPLATYGQLCTSLMATWARKVGVPAPVRAAGAKKLRIGIVSAHIHSHSVWHAILRGWVEHLDPASFELHLFHTGNARDAETEWASRRVAHLRQGVGDWKAASKLISDSRLDVLIYPEIGMDSTTVRLASLRLARVQLASWGHPLTTGLPTIDGYLSAEAFEPADAPLHYTEKLITLPRLGCCYRPFGVTPAKLDLAAFGIAPGDRVLLCAGTPFKYAPRDDALWVDIARRCAPCKLVFFRDASGQLAALLEQRLRGAFEAAGVSFEASVRFLPWQPHAAFFGLLDRCDVYLDSVGFSGFNTTMQAIERGTPVVAWEGEFMRGRFASGILRQAGLAEWVADSAAGYAERVERLCADRGLRERVRGQIVAQRASLLDDRATVAALAEHLIRLAAA